MRRFLAVLAVLALGATAASANGVGAFGSYWDTKDAESGFGGGAKLAVDLGSVVNLELRGAYFPDLSDDVGAVNVDLKATAIEAGAVLRMPLSDTLALYVGGGGGYYLLEADSDLGDVDIDDEAGWYAVAGLEIGLSDSVAIIAEAKYTSLEATAQNDDIDELRDGADVDLTGLGANAGLMLKW